MVFTEQGVAMLSSVLHSGRAIEVNIAIMRAFVRMRELFLGQRDLARKMEADVPAQAAAPHRLRPCRGGARRYAARRLRLLFSLFLQCRRRGIGVGGFQIEGGLGSGR